MSAIFKEGKHGVKLFLKDSESTKEKQEKDSTKKIEGSA